MARFTFAHETTGNTFSFPSEAAWLAALDWYAKCSKRELIDYYALHDTAPVGAIWSDENCSRLADDWADTVMEMWAGAN